MNSARAFKIRTSFCVKKLNNFYRENRALNLSNFLFSNIINFIDKLQYTLMNSAPAFKIWTSFCVKKLNNFY